MFRALTYGLPYEIDLGAPKSMSFHRLKFWIAVRKLSDSFVANFGEQALTEALRAKVAVARADEAAQIEVYEAVVEDLKHRLSRKGAIAS